MPFYRGDCDRYPEHKNLWRNVENYLIAPHLLSPFLHLSFHLVLLCSLHHPEGGEVLMINTYSARKADDKIASKRL